jgi:hypothetical protein
VTIHEDAQWINSRWEHLTTSRFLGTPRPWRQPPRRKAGKRPEYNAPPTFSTTPIPAPLHLDTHDLINHILRKTRQLATLTALELEHPQILAYLQHHRSRGPGEELDYLLRHHEELSTKQQALNENTVHRIRARMAEAFNEILDGQQLSADCPWCGKQDLHIRLIGPPHAQQPVVVCENDGCNPMPAECGKWWRGHPAWPMHEWEWLAKRIGA